MVKEKMEEFSLYGIKIQICPTCKRNPDVMHDELHYRLEKDKINRKNKAMFWAMFTDLFMLACIFGLTWYMNNPWILVCLLLFSTKYLMEIANGEKDG